MILHFKGSYKATDKIKCEECCTEETVADINADKVRIHKLHGRLVCECCHEDLTERDDD